MLIDLKKSTLLPAIILFILFVNTAITFSAVSSFQMVSYACLGIEILSLILIINLYFRNNEVTWYDGVIIMFFLFIIGSTFINSTSVKDAFYKSTESLLLMMMFRYYRQNCKMVITVAFIALSFAIYLNFAYMLMNPTWLVETEKEVSGYLLGGNYNQMGGRMLCAIVTGIVCVRYSKLWLINLIPLTIISVTSVSLVSSTTSLACIILFIVLACIPSSALKVLASVCISIFVLIFQVFVVFSGKGVENNPVIVYIVQDVFEKDLTFTNRTSMWDASLRAFSDSPLIGWGYVDTDWYVTRMESSAVGPHNFLLQVLINGGVVLLILFAIFCYMSLKDIRKNMSNELSTIVFGIVIMSLMMTMEVYPYFYVIYMFMLVYYYNDYSKQNIKVKEGLS